MPRAGPEPPPSLWRGAEPACRAAKDEAQRPLGFQVHQAISWHLAFQAGPTRGADYPSCFFT